jgi:hypothetical protein
VAHVHQNPGKTKTGQRISDPQGIPGIKNLFEAQGKNLRNSVGNSKENPRSTLSAFSPLPQQLPLLLGQLLDQTFELL